MPLENNDNKIKHHFLKNKNKFENNYKCILEEIKYYIKIIALLEI
jgi:hypothetical protein